jgi:hypothetical protein
MVRLRIFISSLLGERSCATLAKGSSSKLRVAHQVSTACCLQEAIASRTPKVLVSPIPRNLRNILSHFDAT